MGPHCLSGHPTKMRSGLIALLCLAVASAIASAQADESDYNLVVCHEPDGVTPENDDEVDRHCTHEKVDSRSIPARTDLTESDRLWGWKCTVAYAGQCAAACVAKSNVGTCCLRWYWWIFLIKEVNCSCLLYGTTTAAATT